MSFARICKICGMELKDSHTECPACTIEEARKFVPMPTLLHSRIRPHPLADVVYWIVYRVDDSRAGGEFHSYLITRESDDWDFYNTEDRYGDVPTKYFSEPEAIAAAKATYRPWAPTGIQCYRTTVTQTLIAP